MASAAPNESVLDLYGLVAACGRTYIVESCEIREREARNSPIECRARHAGNAGCAGDVLLESVKVRRSRPVDVVVDSEIIGDRPEGVHQTDRGIQALRRIRSTHTREWIRQAVLGIAVLKSKVKIGRLRTLSAPSRPTAASLAETSSGRRALTESALGERMIQPNVDIVRPIRHRRQVMKVLNVAR